MRRIFKKQSTRAERKFYEVLKEMKIPFKYRWIIQSKEVDFLIGRYAIEINGHEQNTDKNEFLVSLNYIPIHFSNKEVNKQNIINLIKNNKNEFNKFSKWNN